MNVHHITLILLCFAALLLLGVNWWFGKQVDKFQKQYEFLREQNIRLSALVGGLGVKVTVDGETIAQKGDLGRLLSEATSSIHPNETAKRAAQDATFRQLGELGAIKVHHIRALRRRGWTLEGLPSRLDTPQGPIRLQIFSKEGRLLAERQDMNVDALLVDAEKMAWEQDMNVDALLTDAEKMAREQA